MGVVARPEDLVQHHLMPTRGVAPRWIADDVARSWTVQDHRLEEEVVAFPFGDHREERGGHADAVDDVE